VSRPFREEPETDIHLHFNQHCRNVHNHWSGVFNLLKFEEEELNHF